MPRLPLLTLAAFVLTLSACGADGADGPARPEVAASPNAHDTHDAQPADSEPSASPAAAPSQRQKSQKGQKGQKPLPVMGQPIHRTTPASHLLTADRMPSPDGETPWRIADRGREDAVVGACQKTDLQTIGAISAVRRSFASGPDGPWATQVVAEFADAKSAWRAHEVLRAWQTDCEGGWTSTAPRSGRCAPWTSAPGPARATGRRTAPGPPLAAGPRGWAQLAPAVRTIAQMHAQV